jgi:flagellar motor switch/type III secretory pathway protein FliN
VTLRRLGFGAAVETAAEQEVLFALLSAGAPCGFLGVQPLFAWSLINAATGLALRRTPGPLRGVERGLVAAQLLAIASAWGFVLDLKPQPDRLPSDGLGAVRYQVHSFREGTLGEITFYLSPDALAPSPSVPSVERVPFSVNVAVAVVTLTREEWQDAAAGDTVVCDDGRPLGGAERSATLSVGEWRLDVVLTSAGELSRGRASRPGPSVQTTPSEEKVESSMSSGPLMSPLGLLAKAPVVATVELDQVTLTGAELAALAEGHVLETSFRPGASQVTLRVAGQPWAEGDLVEVEGQLGVRIRRVFDGGIAESELDDEPALGVEIEPRP